ncbi:RluA family pseudouridine synthase [Paenibacillus athensensis]|uniref:Pseudouridine synthase n=1 Tax=Paenibacillus athensensis TaxID=1967502 RepID=A0A4Y8PVQ4_9BACL|nr:RluA family pseudouridine synthase [Paenibacillus athensensis]MCD1258194.1 RluA family pseudouridine synthase [Paenibacillus athensensis]
MSGWTRKGDWLELPLPHPDWQPQAPQAAVELARLLPVPDKLYRRLASSGGVRTSGGKLHLRLFAAEEPQFEPEYDAGSELDILYEDAFCLVVNKPADMSVHPAERNQRGTLAGAVAWHYAATGQACAVRHIHRLDKDTTGAVLYAKNEWAHALLGEAMERKQIDRRYCAVVAGAPAARQGTVREPIGRDRHHAGKRRVSHGGDAAVTHYKVREQLRDAAWIELRLETGRTHQIRVHMSHLGHPLIGDALYGGAAWFPRQALHGERLLFAHPVDQTPVDVHAPLPGDLRGLLDKLRA